MQTARLTDPMNGEAKMEFRGHDNVVEVVAFAPVAAYAAIRELGGLPVGQDVLLIARFFDTLHRIKTERSGQEHILLLDQETRRSRYGIATPGN